jgi:hypothetical protein
MPRRGEILVERMVKLKQSAVGTEYISSLTGLAHNHQKHPTAILSKRDIVKLTTTVKNTNMGEGLKQNREEDFTCREQTYSALINLVSTSGRDSSGKPAKGWRCVGADL